jgi:hypothetical protein
MMGVTNPPPKENPMTTVDFITELFCRVDDTMAEVPRHSQAKLAPSEIVTLALLWALKGTGQRAFWRWLTRDYQPLFPHLPDRTRLFRLFATHQDWTERFLAAADLLAVADSYGIELLHPMREGRSPDQLGAKGLSNHRWIVGVKFAVVLNAVGQIVDWDVDTANVADNGFAPWLAEQPAVVYTDQGFHRKEGDAANIKICKRGSHNERMVVETVFSMLTVVCHFKHLRHRVWEHLTARVAATVALFNVLTGWAGLPPDATGRVHLSIAEFSL